MKNKLANDFDSNYLDELNDPCAGCNNNPAKDMLQCLCDNYREVTILKLDEEEKSIAQNFDINELFGTFVRRVEGSMDAAEVAK